MISSSNVNGTRSEFPEHCEVILVKARAATPERLATSPEVAEYLRQSVKTLANWRSQGKGPKYSKPGGHDVRYDWADVRAWVASQTAAAAELASAS